MVRTYTKALVTLAVLLLAPASLAVNDGLDHHADSKVLEDFTFDDGSVLDLRQHYYTLGTAPRAAAMGFSATISPAYFLARANCWTPAATTSSCPMPSATACPANPVMGSGRVSPSTPTMTWCGRSTGCSLNTWT